MAPKKDKDPSALIATLVALPHEEQVDLLAQALLREYMHRKHYASTLKVFDEENPRDERTISSRALMSELMFVSPAQAAYLKERGVETIMEMLCSMRVEKATTVEERWAEIHKILDTQPPQVPPSYFDELRSLEEEIAKTKKRIKKAKRNAASNAPDAPGEAPSEKKKKKKKLMSIDDLLDQDDSEKIKKLKKKQKSGTAQVPTPGSSSEPQTLIATQSTRPLVEAAALPSPASSQKRMPLNDSVDNSSSDSNSGSSSSSESEDDYASSLRKIKEEEQRMLEARSTMKGGWDIAAPPDATEVDAPHETPRRARSVDVDHTPPQHGVAHSSPQRHHGHEVIGRSLAEQLKLALVGSDRRIPSSFWNQGFYFSKDVAYGLLQNEGGCCGVLAVVQARIVADIFGNHRILTENVKRAALVQSFLAILQLIEPRPKNIVIVHPHSGQSHESVASGHSVKDQLASMSAFVKATNFNSMSDVESYLAEHALKPWVDPKGRGMICWMLSCLLTRTICAAQRDMDVESPLVVEHGYCSQELVNLMLCGRCTSNVHNGEIQHGDLLLKGIPATLSVGFLSYMEHRQLIQVGSFAKSPRRPAWVINHESHYTTLFMKDDHRDSIQEAALRSFTPPCVFDLCFWDQLGGHDEEIRLTVTLEKTPVPPVGKDVIVPYLNDIIRTVPEWKTARVGWNGTDPLL